MKCAICGKEDCTKVYATIWIKNPICNDCYEQAKMVDDWARRAIELPSRSKDDGLIHIKYKDAFGNTIQEWAYKRQKNAIKRAQKIVNRLMGPFFED